MRCDKLQMTEMSATIPAITSPMGLAAMAALSRHCAIVAALSRPVATSTIADHAAFAVVTIEVHAALNLSAAMFFILAIQKRFSHATEIISPTRYAAKTAASAISVRLCSMANRIE